MHSCGIINARTCVPTCMIESLEAILRGGGAIMTANKKEQQTNNHCSAPHLAPPHPAIKGRFTGTLTENVLCCAA